MATFVPALGDKLRKSGGGEVNTAEALANKEVVAFYFSAHWCPPCRGFTPMLAEVYNELKESGKTFEVVFVSSDRDQASFEGYHNEQPWLALPFDDRARKAKLSRECGVEGIPTLALYDGKTGELVTNKGRNGVAQDGAAGFPWKPKTFMEMLGDKFISNDGKSIDRAELLGNQRQGRVVGLYFSAHWCGPCRGFTPQLSERYTKLKEAGKDLEIVFVSSDRDQASFDQYHSEMPFLAQPFDQRKLKAELSEHFDVQGIPTLVFVDAATGETITANGRGAISAPSFIEDFPFHPKPVNDLEVTVDGINVDVSLVVMAEGCSDDQKMAISAALEAYAAEEFAKPSRARDVQRFFTGFTAGEIGTKIRGACKLGAASATPQLLLLDLDDQGAYYRPKEDGGFSPNALKAFVQSRKDGTATKGQFGQ